MNETSENMIWKNLNIWAKSALIVVLIMWLAFSAGIILATNGDIIITIVLLCLLWLGFVIITYGITKLNGNSEYY